MSSREKKKDIFYQWPFSPGVWVVSRLCLISTVRQLMPPSASYPWRCQRGSSTYPKWLHTSNNIQAALEEETKPKPFTSANRCTHTSTEDCTANRHNSRLCAFISPFLQLAGLISSHVLPQISTFLSSELFAMLLHGKIVVCFFFILKNQDFGELSQVNFIF